MNFIKKHLGAFISLLGIVAIALTLGWTALTHTQAQAAPPAPKVTCGKKVTYLAYDASKGSGNFGAAVTSTDLATVQKQLKSDFCADPLLFATDNAFAASGLQLDAKTAESKAQQYTNGTKGTKAWGSDVDTFFKSATNFKLVADNHKYYSIGMIPGSSKNVMPSLVRGQDPVDIGMTLTFTYKGVTRELRLECHFQPVEHQRFPNVPPPTQVCVPSPSNNNCGHTTTPTCEQTGTCKTTTPPTPHGCVTPAPPGSTGYKFNPKTCTWYKPPQSYQCQQNGGPNCPTNPAHQPVQSNKPSLTAQPSTVPSNAPKPLPTKPVDTSHPAPPNSSGYNGGGTSNPVVSGTPKPVDTGSQTSQPSSCPFGC